MAGEGAERLCRRTSYPGGPCGGLWSERRGGTRHGRARRSPQAQRPLFEHRSVEGSSRKAMACRAEDTRFVRTHLFRRPQTCRDARRMTATRRLAAILAADVAGYSRLMGADEEGTHDRLKAQRRQLVEPMIAEHRGRIVKTTGDGLLAEFPSVVDA